MGRSATTVKRVRRIAGEGKPEIIESLRNREMTIFQAEKAIIEKARAKSEQKIPEQASDAESENSLVHVDAEYRDVLRPLDGTLHEHVSDALKIYIRRLRGDGRLPKEEQLDE